MARQADREPPVQTPAQPAPDEVPTGDGIRWPTWDDIARLHGIPGVDGSIPEPELEPETETLPEPEAVAEPEPEPDVVAEPEPEAAGEAEAEPEVDTEPEVDAEPESEAAAEPEPEPEPVAVAEPEPRLEPEAEPEATDDATVVLAPVAEPQSEPEAPLAPEPADDATAVVPLGVEPVTDAEPADAPTAVISPVTDLGPAVAADAGASTPARISAFPATSTPPAEGARVTAGPVPMQQREPSMLDVFPVQEHRRRWPLRLAIVIGVLVLLAAAYVGMSYALRDKVPHGATVAGVAIGGLTSSDAVHRLSTQLADATNRPLTVTANDVQGEIDPVSAGLAFDPQATVDGLTGLQLTDPGRLWRQIVGIGAVTPVTTVDATALASAVNNLAGTLSADPVDGSIVFVDGAPHATPAADGWKVDQEKAVRQIADTWLVAARPLTLPTATVAPAITQAETDRALTDVAQIVSGGPVSVTIGSQSATLAAPVLAANASFVPQGGALVLQMNGQALTDALLAQVPGVLTPAADAHFEYQNDAPVIVPGQPGTTLDPTQVATAVAAAATKATDRTATVDLVPTDPSQSIAALQALGIKEVVSEFSTPLTSDHIRDINIKQGAANISGVLVRPGETFSLTQALGPVDTAHGFVEAGVLVAGEHKNGMGGGLSQLSTTTFNAAYFAGFEIVEHTPHSQWYSRYPEGRESTLATGLIDLKWMNNSPYGALVQSWVANGRLYVRIWGTKYWTVQSTTSARSHVQQPTTVYSQSPTCTPEGKGNPGFTVTVNRKVYLGTELRVDHSWTTTYQPQNQTVCGPPPATP